MDDLQKTFSANELIRPNASSPAPLSDFQVFEKLETKRPDELVETLLNVKVAERVREPEVESRVGEMAEDFINKEIEAKVSAAGKKAQDSKFELRKEACNNFGKTESCAEWQQRIMEIISGVWFVIYCIAASVSIVPLMIFSKGIKGVIKVGWLSIVVAVLVYLFFAVGLPLILKFSKGT